MSGRAKRPLNKASVKKANAEFYAKHPELKGKPLSVTGPKQAALRQEWMDLYVKHGGELESAKPSQQKKVGALVSICPTVSPFQELEAKKKRLEERKKIIEKGKNKTGQFTGGLREEMEAAVQRLELNNRAVERAKLADDIYRDSGAPGGPPVGWKRLGEEPNPLPPELQGKTWEDPDSGFRAALYKSEIDGSVVLVYRGTDNAPGWKNNFQQLLGFKSTQYDQAIQLAEAVDNVYDDFEIAGHSLGGGLTSAASIVTDTKGYSFNAAGLHPNSIKDFGKKRSDGDNIIDAFYVKGEILTTVQKVLPIYEAVGQSHKLPAVDKQGYSQWLWEAGTIDRHGMNYIINALEKQKMDDIETINTPIKASLDRTGKVTDIPLIDNVANFFARDNKAREIINSLSDEQFYHLPTSTKNRLIKELEEGWTSDEETSLLKRAYKSYNPDTDGTLLEDALDATDWANRDDRALDIVNSLSNEQLAKLPKSTKDRLIKNLEAGWTSAQENSAITRLKRAP